MPRKVLRVNTHKLCTLFVVATTTRRYFLSLRSASPESLCCLINFDAGRFDSESCTLRTSSSHPLAQAANDVRQKLPNVVTPGERGGAKKVPGTESTDSVTSP